MAEPRYAVILAGGSSERMGEGKNKLLMRFGGITPIERCVRAFARFGVDAMVIAASPACMDEAERLIRLYPNIICTKGGETRGESARNALAAVPDDAGAVAIHDAARCLVSGAAIEASFMSAESTGCGVAAIPVRDTLRCKDGAVTSREGLFAIQTPQTFDLPLIRKAYAIAATKGEEYTDDLGVWLAAGNKAVYTQGDIMNQKLTFESDLAFFEAGATGTMHIGFGEDTHRLVEGRKLILGGVDIPYEKGLLGHSDADALTHAVIDALLGAAALGDIGRHFPDSDERYRGISSLFLLESTAELLNERGFCPVNIDATVIAQRPKLAPYIDAMRESIASVLGMEASCVSVKATTSEEMNAEGRGECITARAVCTARKNA